MRGGSSTSTGTDATDPLHVVHLYDGHERVYRGRGSVPGVVWNLARETAAVGHEVTVVERQWDGLDASATHDGVAFERVPLRTGADEPWERVPYEQVTSPVGLARLVVDRTNFARHARWRLRGRSFDVLHVHLPFAASVLAAVAPGLRERMVYTAHLGELRLDALTDDQHGASTVEGDGNAVGDEAGDDAEPSSGDGDGRVGGGLQAPAILSSASPDVYLAKRVGHTTVLNESIADAFADRGVDPATVSVLPNGVDVDRFTNVSSNAVEHVRGTYDLGPGPTVLFVGTIMPRKGVLDLVRAMGRLADGGVEEFDLVLAGEDELDGDYVETVHSVARNHGVAAETVLPGFVPSGDLPALYAVADAFVLPSLEEGFGMTAVEALAAGTPVVGTRVGAVPEIVDEAVHGHVVDPGDAPALADAVERTLSDLARTDGVAGSCRDRASEYSWDAIGRQCLATYRRVVG